MKSDAKPVIRPRNPRTDAARTRLLNLEALETRSVPAFFGFWPKAIIPSQGPVAVNDVAATRDNAGVKIDVLANDEPTAAPIDLTSVRVVTQPTLGRVSVDPVTGEIAYFPQLTGTAPDTFQYTVADTFGVISNPATVSIDVSSGGGAAGAIVTGDDATTPSEVPVAIPILANDVPVPGTTIDPATIAIVAPPAHGTLVVNHDTGFVTYTPSFGYIGPDAFRYTVGTGDETAGPADVIIDVQPAAPRFETDPAGGSMLVVYGTNGDDQIRLTPAAGGFMLRINGETKGVYTGASRVVIFAGAGDDQVSVAEAVATPAWIYGGGGQDDISTGGGGGVVFGGAGNDRINGGTGRDILFGGVGSDWLVGGSGEDVLFGGTTDFENPTPAGFLAASQAWNSTLGYPTRVANLLAFLVPGITVHDDAAPDRLDGGPGRDWFLFDPQLDQVSDRAKDQETMTPVGA